MTDFEKWFESQGNYLPRYNLAEAAYLAGQASAEQAWDAELLIKNAKLKVKTYKAEAEYATILEHCQTLEAKCAELERELEGQKKANGFLALKAQAGEQDRGMRSSHKPSMNGQQDTHPTTECREPEDERLHMALEKLRASAARWDAIETLMILGDVDLTQEEDGGYCIYVEPVENILPTAWEGGTPHEAADKVVAQLATPNAELRPTCADLSRKVAP